MPFRARLDMASNKSHFTEIMQKTRIELENGDLTMEELDDCIRAFRLQPVRVEFMRAGPESSIMWDRTEWLRDLTDEQHHDGSLSWKEPHRLVPHS